MAQVAGGTAAQPDVDYHLDYQFRAWESVREYVAWWSDMDWSQREAFHLEWVGITEARLRELRRWAEEGRLTPAQQARYAALMALVAERRDALTRLLAI
jgi:hypothetical protein